MSGELLSCPQCPEPAGLDLVEFRDAVVHDRCPLSGCALEPCSRTTGLLEAGRTLEETTGRCDPSGGGCGAEWALHGANEVAWYGREVSVDFDWDALDADP